MANKRQRDPTSRTQHQVPAKKPKNTIVPHQREAVLPYLPEDVIHYNILPRVPFKSLCRLKSVRKEWNRVISDDDLFTVLQHRLATASSWVSLGADDDQGLVFLDDALGKGAHVGVPDPYLSFIGENVDIINILASTSGLLCLHCRKDWCERFLYICNPATKEGGRIPLPSNFCSADSIGLAYDPTRSPNHYKLIHPMRSNVSRINGVEYRFAVFSSDHREWIEREDRVVAVENNIWRDKKPVFANGVLYWDCTDLILWFDCENNRSGYVTMPREQPRFAEHDIGVYNGRLTCTWLSAESLDVWILIESCGCGYKWERMHQACLEKMLTSNADVFFRSFLSLRDRKKMPQALVRKYQIVPLPFEGGERVFFRLVARKKRSVAAREKEKAVLSYDMKTGKFAEIFKGDEKELLLFKEGKHAFGYCNSMLPFPKIAKIFCYGLKD